MYNDKLLVIWVFFGISLWKEREALIFIFILHFRFHWMVGLYYYGFLVNEGIGLILMHTFYQSTLI